MLTLSNHFLEFCLSTAFSSIILFHMFVQAFDTLKIQEHCFGTRDSLKKVICMSILQALFLLLCQLHINLHIRTNHWLSTYCRQFSTRNHFHVKWLTNRRVTSILQIFPSVPSLVDFSCSIIFRSFISIFCVLIKPRQSLHTVCFWIFAASAPVVWSSLGIAVLRPPRIVSIFQLFLKASSLSSRDSPACFNHSIVFESLLLQLFRAPRKWLRTVRSTHCHHPPV